MLAVKTVFDLTQPEPAAFQFRVCHKQQDIELWSEWVVCSEILYNQFKAQHNTGQFIYQVRRLFSE
jgi:hypothetical protein